ncbi:hypothetical protein [Pseudomonas helleri]|jgi:hypothetical protein|uniref:hypothetical protein n=1 Tax=Pseudomonas helleri TaxID=1608996 RepID=UPI002F356425
MIVQKFESPTKRLGFVVFCLSTALCIIAFLVTYQTYYGVGLYRLGYLVFDRSSDWQQTAFRIGLAGAAIGAALAWDFLSAAKRIYKWVKKG